MVERTSPERITSPEVITPDAISNRVHALLTDSNLTVRRQHFPGSHELKTVNVHGFTLAERTGYVVSKTMVRRLSRKDVLHGSFGQQSISLVCDTYTTGKPTIEVTFSGPDNSQNGQLSLSAVSPSDQEKIAKLLKLA